MYYCPIDLRIQIYRHRITEIKYLFVWYNLAHEMVFFIWNQNTEYKFEYSRFVFH
jgi:hypothetical protein